MFFEREHGSFCGISHHFMDSAYTDSDEVHIGDTVKKVLYFLCVCALSMMIFSEYQNNNKLETDVEYSKEAVETWEITQDTSSVEEGKNKSSGKVAYLTFDDGPSEVTPDILDTLKKKKAVATFFLIGNEITPEREAIVKRELEEGHQVGVHTFSHEKNEMYCDETVFFEDFNKCREQIQKVTGVAPTLHRFPWGSNNNYVCPIVDDLIARLQEQKVRSFDWNVSGEDSIARNVPKATIYRNVAKDLEKHEQPIILLHDSNTMQNTAAVLGEIIDLISEKGYSFSTLDKREDYMFPASWR